MDREQQIQSVIENISRLQRALSPVAWEKSGLSRAQAGLLYLLYYHKKSSMKLIAQHLAISKSAVSQLVEPLLAKKLVEREVDSQDRRSAVIRLSSKGLKAIKNLNQHKMMGLRTALDSLSEKELAQLSSLHAKMVANITNSKEN